MIDLRPGQISRIGLQLPPHFSNTSPSFPRWKRQMRGRRTRDSLCLPLYTSVCTKAHAVRPSLRVTLRAGQLNQLSDGLYRDTAGSGTQWTTYPQSRPPVSR